MDGALGLGFEGEGFPTLPYRPTRLHTLVRAPGESGSAALSAIRLVVSAGRHRRRVATHLRRDGPRHCSEVFKVPLKAARPRWRGVRLNIGRTG